LLSLPFFLSPFNCIQLEWFVFCFCLFLFLFSFLLLFVSHMQIERKAEAAVAKTTDVVAKEEAEKPQADEGLPPLEDIHAPVRAQPEANEAGNHTTVDEDEEEEMDAHGNVVEDGLAAEQLAAIRPEQLAEIVAHIDWDEFPMPNVCEPEENN
jgi:flagellar biosynthesis/type III secretory pathway M-ring protein FliF/YscJ